MRPFLEHLFVIQSRRHLKLFVLAATTAVVSCAVVTDAVINAYLSPERMWASLLQTSLMSAAMGGVFIAIAARSNFRLYLAKQEFERLSRTDYQTGLLNRRGFFAEVERSDCDRANSYLLIADIDHFKRINDSLGHLVGDDVIAAVGAALNDELLGPRLCGRMGGEEFAIVLSNIHASDAMCHAGHIKWRIMKGIARDCPAPRGVTMSIGISAMAGRTLAEAYALADRALYRAKRAGRNCCVMATGDQDPNDPGGGFVYSTPQKRVV